MGISPESAVSRQIESYQVLGTEKDGHDKWVGADMEVQTVPLGRYFLRIVTKQHYVDQHLADSLWELDTTKPDEFNDAPLESRAPFVLNDIEITEEVLDKKFMGRTIEPDLAASLWPIEE